MTTETTSTETPQVERRKSVRRQDTDRRREARFDPSKPERRSGQDRRVSERNTPAESSENT